MSKVSDFFPGGSSASTTNSSSSNAILLLVGGGGGNGVNCHGSGGGGIFISEVGIQRGTTYPVSIGAGGAAACSSPACCGFPGGKGSPGGNTTFGRFKALGGGAAGNACFPTVCAPPSVPFPPFLPCYNVVRSDHGGNAGSLLVSYNTAQPYFAHGGYPTTNIQSVPAGGPSNPALTSAFSLIMFDGISQINTVNGGRGYSGTTFTPIATTCGSIGNSGSCGNFPAIFGSAVLSSTPTPTCRVYRSRFFGLCVGNQPYSWDAVPVPGSPLIAPGPYTGGFYCSFDASYTTIACSRYYSSYPGATLTPTTPLCCIYCCGLQCAPQFAFVIPANPNTGHAALGKCTAGDSGVAVIIYPCPLGAATAAPGAVDCTPVTGPQGFRAYKFTSSGSFTL